MIDTKALRQKILDLAIRGKLVPQDPDDEPASVLLERIRQQKQQMVKAGKLKPKDIKDDSVIFVGEDNLHYEKFADGSVKCIEDEIPFDIPNGWIWCRLSQIITLFSGQDLDPSRYNNEGIGIPYITGASNLEDGKVAINRWTDSPTTHATDGDLLITCKGSGVGKMAWCDICDAHIARQIMALRCVDGLLSGYLEIVISAMLSNIRLKANGLIPGLSREIILEMMFPLPSLEEQKRICSKSREILSYIDGLNSQKSKLVGSVGILKSKILDLAIRGQLIPQDPNDEPASVLLERIRAEKEELIKQGKIKRDKKESVIFRGEDNSYYLNNCQTTVDINDDLPFDIPDSWRWVRLKDVFIINPRNKLDDDLDVSFIPMPLIDDGYSGKHATEVRHWKEVKNGFTHFAEGDVGVAKITPCFENRKSTVFENLTNGYGAGTTELHVLRPFGNNIFVRYLLAYIKSDYFVEKGKQTFTGDVGQQRISKAYVENAYFPLPPVKEQERIVQQIGIIFEFLNMITDALS